MSGTAAVQARVTGATRLLAMLGDPVRFVRSPENFNPRIAANGHDALLVPVHLPAADFDRSIQGLMAIANLDGIVLTMPFKERILPYLERTSERVRHVGAANAARRDADGGWTGEMFDGVGLVGAARGIGVDPRGLRVGLIGAGGAGAAIAFELAACSAAALNLTDSDGDRARRLAGRVRQASGLAVEVGEVAPDDLDLVINATPVGMAENDPAPFDTTRLRASTAVIDIVTRPEGTALLAAARAAGCRHADGSAMVAAQTAAMLAFFRLDAAAA